jgi:hypothetical protein
MFEYEVRSNSPSLARRAGVEQSLLVLLVSSNRLPPGVDVGDGFGGGAVF